MKVAVITLGCKVNLYESEFLKSLFKNHDYKVCTPDKSCDIFVLNTCTVTNNADIKTKKLIKSLRKLNPKACLVVCGCFVESSKDYDFKDVDIIIGNYNKSQIVSKVEEFFETKCQINEKEKHNIMHEKEFEDMEIVNLDDRKRAFVKIEDGCDNYCSYCIIPYVRGACRSKKYDQVLKEITSLVKNNYKEIVLTGIHTGAYGKDLNTNFSTLLTDILKIKDLKRLRISSIEITELDDIFFKLLENPIICNHLHIPLQSGSDDTLKKMNRKYDTKYYEEVINKIRSIRKDIAITTDVIVGFPTETDEDFKRQVEFIKKINFAKVHVFPYSKRNGTFAATLKQVDGKIKKERAHVLLSLSERLEKSYQELFYGKTESVLIEKYDGKYSYGHTSNYLYLKIPDKLKENEIYDLKITKDMFDK